MPALVGPPDPGTFEKLGGNKAVFIRGADFLIVEQIGDGPAAPADEDNGWEVIERPAKKPMTEWNGERLLQMAVPIMLDGFAENRSVQGRLDTLRDLGKPRQGEKGKELPPPIFTVQGPVPYPNERWVLASIALATTAPDIIRARDGRLIRQALILNLLEHVRPDQAQIRRKKRKPSRGKTYTVKSGDTWRSIAKRFAEHGASAQEISKYAKQIARRNGARPDIRQELNVGREVRVPPFER